MLKSQWVKLSGRIGYFINLFCCSVSRKSFYECGLNCNQTLWDFGRRQTTTRANDRVHSLQKGLCSQVTPLAVPTGEPHGTCCLLLRAGKTSTPSRPSVSQLLRRSRDAGNNDNVHNVLCQERSFPLGRITVSENFC